MKKILLSAVAIVSLSFSATFITVSSQPAQAASISNPKCVKGLRGAQSRHKYQAFAMIPGGAGCGWTIQSNNSQAEANRTALHYCKSKYSGKGCYVAWPTN